MVTLFVADPTDATPPLGKINRPLYTALTFEPLIGF